MTDYLLVHGAGQGAWSWGRVWGYMTAPVEHPPRLYAGHPASRVYALDLPGHGGDARGDTAAVPLDECVHSVVRTVEREGMRDLVLVGHSFAGPMVLQASAQLPQAPSRVVLVGGIVPEEGQDMLTVLPQRMRNAYRVLALLSKVLGRDFKVPKPAIDRYFCNGMDPMEIVQWVGFFGALPTRALSSRVSLSRVEVPCPVTYVLLNDDKVLPAETQRQMAARIPDVNIVSMDSCHQPMLQKPRELADILLGLT